MTTLMTTIFDSPIREFKTKKAAERYCSRIINKTVIKESVKSSFDMFHPIGKKLYCVYLEELN